MIVGNIKRVIRTKILMIFIYAEFIQPTESTYPYMSLPVFTECRNLLIGYISLVTRGLCLSTSETKSFPLRVHENNKKIKNKRLNVFILSIAS